MTAEEFHAIIFGAPVDGAYTFADCIRLLAAVAAGLREGGGEVIFQSLDNTKPRVRATMTGRVRSDVALDLT